MSSIRNTIIKAGLVVSISLVGFAGITTKITNENFTAISNELGQNSIEIHNKSDKVYYESKYDKLGGQDGLIQAGKDLVEEIEGEGAVLLKNQNSALPLSKGTKVSLFGMTSLNPSVGGRGSAHAGSKAQPAVNLKDGLEQAGLVVNEDLYKYYEGVLASPKGPFYAVSDMPFDKVSRSDRKNKAILQRPDLVETFDEYGTAVYIITRTGAEASDLGGKMVDGVVENDGLVLTDEEKSILKGLTDLKKQNKIDKIILLLNSTNQIPSKEFAPYDIDATMWIGHVGITGTNAIGDLLVGDRVPSGHLVDTFWYDHRDNPVMMNYGAYKYTNRDEFASQLLGDESTDGYGTYVAYQEGIYNGYRYTETRYTDVINQVAGAGDFDYDKVVSYPFGYGLSYTDFKLSDFKVEKDGDNFNVSVKVTNSGKTYSGKDVVQIYLQKPYTDYDKQYGVEKAAVELVGYAKTSVLAPGASQTVEVVVSEDTFKSYDANHAKTYVISEGDYLLTAAHDAHNAANNFLKYNKKDVNGDKNMVYSKHYGFDDRKYATSRGTGAEITNLFDDNNYNNIPGNEGKLEFMTRSNWSKELNNKLTINQFMVDEINRQQSTASIKKDDGEYPTYGAHNDLQLIQLMGKDYNDEIWDKFLDQLTWDETVELVRIGLRTTQPALLLGKPKTLDHNGPTGLTELYNKGDGLAKATGDPDGNVAPVYYPSIPVLAATYNKDLAAKFGDMLGEDALWAGYNGLYGIGLNAHRSPYAGRQFEYFSEDPFLSGTMAAAEVKALQAMGTTAYIKHFALNDQETQRFGVQVWSNEQALREISLKPFEYAVIDGGAMNAMSSFSRIGLQFAPASKALMTDFLRGELGMKGFVVTDMYTLGYVPESMPQFIMAGTDIPDGEISADIYNQFKTGYSEFAWHLRESAKRLMYSTLSSNAMNGFDQNTKVVMVTPPWKVAVNSFMIGSSVLAGGFVIWAVVAVAITYKLVGKKKNSKDQEI